MGTAATMPRAVQAGHAGPAHAGSAPAGVGAFRQAMSSFATGVSNILTKLQVADRAQAIVQARDAGLGQRSWV
jgi:hypothetical protein